MPVLCNIVLNIKKHAIITMMLSHKSNPAGFDESLISMLKYCLQYISLCLTYFINCCLMVIYFKCASNIFSRLKKWKNVYLSYKTKHQIKK